MSLHTTLLCLDLDGWRGWSLSHYCEGRHTDRVDPHGHQFADNGQGATSVHRDGEPGVQLCVGVGGVEDVVPFEDTVGGGGRTPLDKDSAVADRACPDLDGRGTRYCKRGEKG